jgi:uncharacterized protein YjbJ (UPF0337 family)
MEAGMLQECRRIVASASPRRLAWARILPCVRGRQACRQYRHRRPYGATTCFRPLKPFWKEFDMNWDIVEGNWKQFKGNVKAQWGKLTDDQLDVIAGRRTELAGRIQESYGVTKDEAERQIRDFEKLNQ